MTSNPALGFGRTRLRVEAQRQRGDALFAVLLILGGSLIASTASGSPHTTLAAGVALSAVIWMFWRGSDLRILLLPAIYQWLEVALKPIMTVVYGLSIDQVLLGTRLSMSPLEPAALYGFADVVCLSLGIYIGARRSNPYAAEAVRLEAQRWELELVLRVCLSAIVLGHLLIAFAGLTGPAYQPVLALGGIRLIGVFILAYWCFVNSKGYRYLAAVIGFEILMGMSGFFAEFRGPVLVAGIAALAARSRLGPSTIVSLAFFAIITLLVASFWSAVKTNYRDFVSNGLDNQSISRPLEERFGYLYNAVSEVDSSKLEDGYDQLLARLSYIDYLSATLAYVPTFVPHQNGALVGKAIENMLMPRVLFPDKAPLPNDTEVTIRYTGMQFASAEYTSISIGYLAELYVDFGVVGALIAITIIGVAVGMGYRVLRDYQRGSRLIALGACVTVAYSLSDFAAALVKFINAAVLTFAAALVIQRLLAPMALAHMMSRRTKVRETPRSYQ